MTGPGSARARPRLVDVATILVCVAAGLNAAVGPAVIATFSASQALVRDRAIEQGTSPEQLQALLTTASVVIVVVAIAYAAALVVLALLFRAGRPWARVALFACTLLSPFSLLSPNLLAVAVVVLLVAADVIMYRPVVTRWVRSLRGLRAA